MVFWLPGHVLIKDSMLCMRSCGLRRCSSLVGQQGLRRAALLCGSWQALDGILQHRAAVWVGLAMPMHVRACLWLYCWQQQGALLLCMCMKPHPDTKGHVAGHGGED